MNKIMNKKILKLLIALLIIVALSMTCIGCGFAGADNSAKKGDVTYPSNHVSKNKLLTVWANAVTSCNTNGDPTDDIGTVQLKATVDYGDNVNKTSTVTIARDVAIFMYGTVFQSSYPHLSTDKFYGNFTFLGTSGMKLMPDQVVKSMSAETRGAFRGDGGLDTIMTAVESVASAIFAMLWVVGFLSQVVNEKFTMETMLKSCMQFISGILLIRNVGLITDAFVGVGEGLMDMADATTTLESFAEFQKMINDTLLNGITSISIGFSLSEMKLFQVGICSFWLDWGSLVAIGLMAVPMYAQVMCAYKIISIMVTRTLELAARIALAPIPVSFAAQNGFTPESLRYFRGLLACAMQPVLIAIGAACFDEMGGMVLRILSTAGDNGFTELLAMVITYFVLSAYIGETKHLAQEIIAR